MQPATLHQVFQTIRFSLYFGEFLDLSPAQKDQFNILDKLWSNNKKSKIESEKLLAFTYLRRMLDILDSNQIQQAKTILVAAKEKEARIQINYKNKFSARFKSLGLNEPAFEAFYTHNYKIELKSKALFTDEVKERLKFSKKGHQTTVPNPTLFDLFLLDMRDHLNKEQFKEFKCILDQEEAEKRKIEVEKIKQKYSGMDIVLTNFQAVQIMKLNVALNDPGEIRLSRKDKVQKEKEILKKVFTYEQFEKYHAFLSKKKGLR